MKILIVDDLDAFRKVLIELLMRAGFHDVVEASNLDQAIERFVQEKPEICFVDMILPGKSETQGNSRRLTSVTLGGGVGRRPKRYWASSGRFAVTWVTWPRHVAESR